MSSCSAANFLAASLSPVSFRATLMSTMDPDVMSAGRRMDGNSICPHVNDSPLSRYHVCCLPIACPQSAGPPLRRPPCPPSMTQAFLGIMSSGFVSGSMLVSCWPWSCTRGPSGSFGASSSAPLHFNAPTPCLKKPLARSVVNIHVQRQNTCINTPTTCPIP